MKEMEQQKDQKSLQLLEELHYEHNIQYQHLRNHELNMIILEDAHELAHRDDIV